MKDNMTQFLPGIRLLRSVGLAAAICTVASPGAAEPVFVSPDRLHGMLILAAPAASTSATTVRELAELHLIEASRTPEQVARAIADDNDESVFLFRDVIGANFNARSFPFTALLSTHVGHDESANTDPLKTGFGRVRPYNADRSLRPVCKTKKKDDSYPSGHATAGYLQALTLIELVPEKRDAILARADDYAQNRLVCGVHYRSDIEAARLVAYSVHAMMRESAQFKAELSAARDEFRAVGQDALSSH
jgi:acid phosphatase (class A)